MEQITHRRCAAHTLTNLMTQIAFLGLCISKKSSRERMMIIGVITKN